MLEPIRTKHGDCVNVLSLSDERFAALGSNKVYDSLEGIQKSFSRSIRFSDSLYSKITEIEGGFKANLIENGSITVYFFKGMSRDHISNVICSDKKLQPNADFQEYLNFSIEEVLVAVEQLQGSEYTVGVTRVMGGMHHSTLIPFQLEN